MKFNLTAFGTGFTQGLADNIQQQRDRRAQIADNLALYTRKKGVDKRLREEEYEKFLSGDGYQGRVDGLIAADPRITPDIAREYMNTIARSQDPQAAYSKAIIDMTNNYQSSQSRQVSANMKWVRDYTDPQNPMPVRVNMADPDVQQKFKDHVYRMEPGLAEEIAALTGVDPRKQAPVVPRPGQRASTTQQPGPQTTTVPTQQPRSDVQVSLRTLGPNPSLLDVVTVVVPDLPTSDPELFKYIVDNGIPVTPEVLTSPDPERQLQIYLDTVRKVMNQQKKR